MTRREIREEIFKLLFEKELTDNNVEKRIEETIKENNIRKEENVEFLKSYIIDIIENEEVLIEKIKEILDGWTYERLGTLEKVLLKISFYEITIKKIGYEICKNIIATKQQANAIYDMETYYPVYEKDLLETNNKVIISSPGINRVKVHSFIKIIQKHQERGVKFTVITLNPESYPENRIETTKELVGMLTNVGINVRLKEYMHEHYAVIVVIMFW